MATSVSVRHRAAGPLGRIKRRAIRPLRRLAFLRDKAISTDFGWDRGLPIDRYYIERFLAAEADRIRGRVLEIGHNHYTARFGGSRVDRCDVLHYGDETNPEATIVADLADAPDIPSDSFDCLVAIHTLQLIYDVRAAIRTMHRILKPGGTALVSVPGITRICPKQAATGWRDYWRFTSMSAERLFAETFGERVAVFPCGNLFAATAGLYGFATEDVNPARLDEPDPAIEYQINVCAEKAA